MLGICKLGECRLADLNVDLQTESEHLARLPACNRVDVMFCYS